MKINKFNTFKHVFEKSKTVSRTLDCKYCNLSIKDIDGPQFIDNYKQCISNEEKLIKDIIE